MVQRDASEEEIARAAQFAAASEGTLNRANLIAQTYAKRLNKATVRCSSLEGQRRTMQAEIDRLKVVEKNYEEEMARREVEVEVAVDLEDEEQRAVKVLMVVEEDYQKMARRAVQVEDEEQEKEHQQAIKVLNGMLKNRNSIIRDLRKEGEEFQVAVDRANAKSKEQSDLVLCKDRELSRAAAESKAKDRRIKELSDLLLRRNRELKRWRRHCKGLSMQSEAAGEDVNISPLLAEQDPEIIVVGVEDNDE